ncbi:hypothetical protein ASG37_02450 [Sphingomonas sp. Leaf407]|uniref:hypothetical protein n=1 Tax=unclassified Sphingomonas TaxID=196159 RepID=UPI0006F7661E|nr:MULTISPECIES: hypothetical protein [unclassified Sphingomonas]KQN40664.1 hypothetical protein ASE97_02475 [Sphingomonas sp. Leaf42]KQT30020.1 hypothetical protein ASG37_02450 [Sphingomonas sp. Leaf407]
MFFKRHLERMRSLFLDQFEVEGRDYLFRKNMKEPPIRVTAIERDAFAADFVRRVKHIVWALLVATVLLCVVPVLIAPDTDEGIQKTVIGIGVGGILTLCLGAGYLAWAAPARALERRLVMGLPRSKAEMRRRALEEMTYGQLVLGLIGAALILISKGMDSWWTIFAGGLVVTALVQAIRKWRFDRSRDN